MGTWGTTSFDNDSAADFVKEVTEDGVVALQEAFDVVLDPDTDYLEIEEGQRALAAAEIVAAGATGQTGTITDAALRAWLADTDPGAIAALRSLALEATERVLGPASELPDLWQDSPDAGAWQADVLRLQKQLG